MPISLILSLVGPVLVNVLTAMFQRMWKQGVTSVQGTVAGAGVVGLLEASGCSLSGVQEGIIGLIAAAPGLLSTDAGKTAPSLWTAAIEKIKAARASVPVPPEPVA